MNIQQVNFIATDGDNSHEVTIYFAENNGVKNVVGYTTNVEPYFILSTPHGRTLGFKADIDIGIDIELNSVGITYTDQHGKATQTEFKSFESLNDDTEFGNQFAMHCITKVWGIEDTPYPEFPGWEHVISHLTQLGLPEEKMSVIKQAAANAGYKA